MDKTLLVIILSTFAILAVGCGPSQKDYTLYERRQIIDNMSDQTLNRLYVEKPATQHEVAEAAGYAVFNNGNFYVLFASGGGGIGVVVDKATGRKTYMRRGAGGVGIGFGAKEFQEIIIFKNRETLTNFVGSGWSVGGHADAAAKTEEKGGAVSGDGNSNKNISVYSLTKKGLTLHATITGSHYWVDDDLNQPSL